MPSARVALWLLRLSLALLMIVWALDKLVNPAHSVAVAESFYHGIGTQGGVILVAGIGQLVLALALLLGLVRRVVYPVLAVVTGMTLVGVWRSVVDPWGWYLEGTNALFFPSSIIFAAVLVLWALQDQDTMLTVPRKQR